MASTRTTECVFACVRSICLVVPVVCVCVCVCAASRHARTTIRSWPFMALLVQLSSRSGGVTQRPFSAARSPSV
eukprot:6198053-Pleurochrysis_carterae.AAC.2